MLSEPIKCNYSKTKQKTGTEEKSEVGVIWQPSVGSPQLTASLNQRPGFPRRSVSQEDVLVALISSSSNSSPPPAVTTPLLGLRVLSNPIHETQLKFFKKILN